MSIGSGGGSAGSGGGTDGAGRTARQRAAQWRRARQRGARQRRVRRTRPVSRPRWTLLATLPNVSLRLGRRAPLPVRRSQATTGAAEQESRHKPLFGFMSLPVSRHVPIRRSTLLMAVAFVGIWDSALSLSTAVHQRRSRFQGFGRPDVLRARCGQCFDDYHHDKHNDHDHSTARCGDNDNDVAPRSLRFHHGTIRIHHYDYGSQHPATTTTTTTTVPRSTTTSTLGSTSTSSSSTTTSP